LSENKSADNVASQLHEAGYGRLLQGGSLVDAVWQDGNNEDALRHIVLTSDYDPYVRLLASEVLYAKSSDYPPPELKDVLPYIYSQALAASGGQDGALIPGNQWGFMYFHDASGVTDYGNLGARLVNVGRPAIPYLVPLLNNSDPLFYEGSQEATLGDSLRYRVKDAAAYYIGKIMGIPGRFHESHADRDTEVERLKAKLEQHRR